MAPGAHSPDRRLPTMMTTADLAFKMDPEYRKISERFYAQSRPVRRRLRPRLVQAHPSRHGAEGPLSRPGSAGRGSDLAGPDSRRHQAGAMRDVADLKRRIAESGLSVSQLVKTAWASAATYRGSDKRGGANGARIRLAPQKDWDVNEPAELAKVLQVYEGIRADFRRRGQPRRPDRARRQCRRSRRRPKRPAMTCRCPSPRAGATRPRRRPTSTASNRSSPRRTASATISRSRFNVPTEELLVDRAQLLGLSAPEMTVLVGGLRVLGANHDGSKARRLHRPAGPAHQRLLRQPARHGHGVEGSRTTAATRSSSAPAARPTRRNGRRPAPTLRSAPTRSSARSAKSMRRTMPARSSSATSSPPGPR